MKKLFVWFFLIVIASPVFALTSTQGDHKLLEKAYEKLDEVYENDIEKFETIRTKIIEHHAQYSSGTQASTLLTALLHYIRSLIHPQFMSTDTYTVLKVVDGDTIDLDIAGTNQRVRLIGVDAPESTITRYGYSECFGVEAYEYLEKILKNKSVIIETDPTQDQKDTYERLLAYVFLDGVNINEQLINDGYGREYTYHVPYLYTSYFKDAQARAQEHQHGLRATGTCAGERKPIAAPRAEDVPSDCPTEVYCKDISTCAQAKYYLTTCKLTRLDSDGDGTPCEALCEP